jgi:hypothetical protein
MVEPIVKSYWKGQLVVNLGKGDVKEDVELFTYKVKKTSIVLKSSEAFGKAFSKTFKENGGRFNTSLKLPNSDGENVKSSGWIFFLQSSDTSLISNMLRDISTGKTKPKVDTLPDFTMNTSREDLWDKLAMIASEIDLDNSIHSEQYGDKKKMIWGPKKEIQSIAEDDFQPIYKFETADNILIMYMKS